LNGTTDNIHYHDPITQNKHGAHYAGLVESDERWKTVYSVWLYQVRFSGYPNFFNFLLWGGSLAWAGWGIFVRYVSKFQKSNNLFKTGSFVEIFHREPTKIINLVKKVVEKQHFLVIFTKTRYCSLDSLDRGTKVVPLRGVVVDLSGLRDRSPVFKTGSRWKIRRWWVLP
jgi:hypothetical protein